MNLAATLKLTKNGRNQFETNQVMFVLEEHGHDLSKQIQNTNHSIRILNKVNVNHAGPCKSDRLDCQGVAMLLLGCSWWLLGECLLA